MRENTSRLLTVHEIAMAAGCSSRALAAAFHAQRGQSIVSYLRDLRLDLGRALLSSGNQPSSVGEVAAALRFSSAGRFAGQYHARFGELPMATAGRRHRGSVDCVTSSVTA